MTSKVDSRSSRHGTPKPPALSLEAARELSEASRRSGKILMINFERRFSYGVSAVREEREPIAGIHDSVETMRLFQAVYDAVRDGRDGVVALR